MAAYARVSTEKDAMLHSLSAQVSYYSTLIQNHPGWEYVGVYSDNAFTGTKTDRPDFQRLLSDCKSGKIDMVLTKSISRFARNTVDLLKVVRELKALGVDVYFEREHIHSISPDGELMLSILASFAQAESLSASENVKWQIRNKFKNGELANFRFMYGYKVSKDKIEINEKEATVVRWIFNQYTHGVGCSEIAKILRDLDISRPRDGLWTFKNVLKILENEKYTGNALLQKRFISDHLTKKSCKNRGELPMYYATGTHEAIIDEDIFKKANEIIKYTGIARLT